MRITDLSSTADMPAGISAKGVYSILGLRAPDPAIRGRKKDTRAARSIWLFGAGVIAFDNLPEEYLFTGGGQRIGSFYFGVTFGSNVTGSI
jgi:hypothetical protein